jgi:REP element-mobilizing transposase RayT
MGRQIRIEYAGATYHVMSRGNRRETIFQDDKDRQMFVDTLEEACARTGWQICAYVLMPNHYHLIVETPEANLVVGMKWLQGTYAKRHNARHRDWGHVFQGRYKSILIDPAEGDYFRIACDYVHLNPARAFLAGTGDSSPLTAYVWSSSRYLSRPVEETPEWLNLGRISLAFAQQPDSAEVRGLYLSYLESRSGGSADEQEYSELRSGWCLGSPEYKKAIQARAGEHFSRIERDSVVGEVRRMHDEQTAEAVLIRAADKAGLNLAEKDCLRKNDERKVMIAWVLATRTAVRQEWIAERLGMGSRANVSRAIHQMERSKEESAVKWKESAGDMYICVH